MYAKIAATYIAAFCRETFDENPESMESTMCSGQMIDVFDHVGYGTHKYIPTERLNDDLELPQGAGVYSFWKMTDGSLLLLTCGGRLAYWSGSDEDKAEWPERRKEKV